MSKHKHSFDHQSEEHRLLHLIDQLSLRRWLSLWLGSVILSAGFYCVASFFLEGNGIRNTIHSELDATVSFPTALYFSCVTTTTLGYGDYAPEGLSRFVAIFQALLGMIVVGVVISKMLSRHQEQMIQDTNQIALDERTARVLTGLHAELLEFQAIQAIGTSQKLSEQADSSRERLLRRWENAQLRFCFLLESIHQLLRARDIQPDTKSKVLRALRNTVVEFVAASKVCGSSIDESITSGLIAISNCPTVNKGLTDDPSVAEIVSILNASNQAS